LPLILCANPAFSQSVEPLERARRMGISEEVYRSSPVLQRWLRQIPNVGDDIQNDPSFRTRYRFGYTLTPSQNNNSGIAIGVEDLLFDRTRFGMSASYERTFGGDRNLESYGGDIHYYLLPLGGYVNVAPVIGYRHIETSNYSQSGLNIGARIELAFGRGGGGDVTISQTFMSPGHSEEVGLLGVSTGYAISPHLRLAIDATQQNSRVDRDTRLGFLVEWMP
jgi:hypothetical protein